MSEHTVLVVDDDADLRRSVCEALRDEGYRAIGAAHGREALERLRDEHPCVIVLDLMMPVMNGWEFRDEQRRDPTIAGIPVVVLTAMGPAARTQVQADDVLTKPITLDDLIRTITKHCGPA